MARLDPDAIEDALRVLVDKLLRDCRTVCVALRLEDLRRDIGRILAVNEPALRRVDPGTGEMSRRAQLTVLPCETSRQARQQGAGDGLRISDLEASVAAHSGRFVEVHAG